MKVAQDPHPAWYSTQPETLSRQMPSHALAQSCIHKPGHRYSEGCFLSDCSSTAGLLRHLLCKFLIAYVIKSKSLAWSDLFLPLHTHTHRHIPTVEFIQTSSSTPTAFPHRPHCSFSSLAVSSQLILLVLPSQKLALPAWKIHGIVSSSPAVMNTFSTWITLIFLLFLSTSSLPRAQSPHVFHKLCSCHSYFCYYYHQDFFLACNTT